MTAPTEPLITIEALRSWTQQAIDDDDPFAGNILMGVSIKLWQYGDESWTRETLPREARLIGELKAKNYFEHPTGASREQVDVISETFINDVLLGLTFTQTEQDELRALAGPGTGGEVNVGVWALTVTRGPLETHQGRPRGAEYYDDSWGSPFPLLDSGYFLGPR